MGVTSIDLLRIRAALSAGLTPSEALSAVTEGPLVSVTRQLRVGRSIHDLAVSGSVRDATGARVLRALAVAERCGTAAVDALDLVLETARDTTAVQRLLVVKTAQARGTAKILALIPLVGWALLVLIDPRALRFYTTAMGWITGGAAIALGLIGRSWSGRLVERAAGAARRSDPLVGEPAGFQPVRALTVALPVVVIMSIAFGIPLALALGLAVVGITGRSRATPGPEPAGCTTADVIALLGMTLGAGTALDAALEQVAAVTEGPAQAHLRTAARRLRSGWTIEAAFEGGFGELGSVLAVTECWGVSAAEPMSLLIDDLRSRQRAASEEAAERVQLSLVFPTTLLTLPAFVLAVVPPLLWTALAA